MSNHLPSPPRVFAPDRLGTDQPAGSMGPVTAGSLTASGAPTPRTEGAQVTAVVGPPTVGTPEVTTPVTTPQVTTPQVAAPKPPPGTQLARTGFDSGPVLLLALLLVLLGLVLVRLAVPRATSSL